jgi:arylsulfatase A-like enzyme
MLLAFGLFAWTLASRGAVVAAERPNILVIITDDQGYGDLGVHDNPKIKTPNLDRFARQSVRLKSFYVSPVCAPTRASLLTGRYNYRTGVVDTYLGRAMMHPDEVTLAEMLARGGYRTAIFGKWHLGDNARLRPLDQGFHESLVIKGGGIGQPSDPPGGSSYLDPVLQHNGKEERYKGYCSDIFANSAIEFLSKPATEPFFIYLAFNCPHEPLQAPEGEIAEYHAMNLALREFPQLGQPIPATYVAPQEMVARVYAMVTNIDTNVGRVLKALDDRGLAANTIVVFLTDNGPAFVRFNDGLRGWKGSVHDGGIRVPCYIRWPGHFPPGHTVDRIAAHIDLVPTLLDACGLQTPAGVKLDGRSLLLLLRGIPASGWPDRTLYFQWHRGDHPDVGRAFAARSQRYKLLRPEPPPGARKAPALELYDMERDPYELHDIASRYPDVVKRLQSGYLAWFKDVTSTRAIEDVRIEVGGRRENPTILTRQDWRGPRAGAGVNDLGYWDIVLPRAGRFNIKLELQPRRFPTEAHFAVAGATGRVPLAAGATECLFQAVAVAQGPARFEAWVEGKGNSAGVWRVTVSRINDSQ